MRLIGYIFILILLVVGVSFSVLNATPVSFHYYFGTRSIPLSLLLVLSFIAGLLIASIAMFFKILKLKAQKRFLRRKLKTIEKEIENLRVLPIKE